MLEMAAFTFVAGLVSFGAAVILLILAYGIFVRLGRTNALLEEIADQICGPEAEQDQAPDGDNIQVSIS